MGPTWRFISTERVCAYGLAGILGVALAQAATLPASVTVPASLLNAYRPPPLPPPPATALERDRLDLGRKLFFDPILSRGGALSCSTCHNPGLSWTNGLAKAIGNSGASMSLRAPTLIDVDMLDRFGWDGKFASLDAVTFGAMTGHKNMDLTEAEALARLQRNPGYVSLFQAAFPGQGISHATMSEAMVAFERTIRSGPSPFDRFVAGDRNAIGPAAKRGFLLFNGRARCAQCHGGWAFTDGSFHDIGSATGTDIGRGRLFPTSQKLRYAFKVPTLRDVARRAPYMHDGSVPDLQGVLALYDKGGIDRPSRDVLIRPLGLSDQEKSDLIAFLASLTGAPTPFAIPVLPR